MVELDNFLICNLIDKYLARMDLCFQHEIVLNDRERRSPEREIKRKRGDEIPANCVWGSSRRVSRPCRVHTDSLARAEFVSKASCMHRTCPQEI